MAQATKPTPEFKALVSSDIRQEVEELIENPIINQIANELPTDFDDHKTNPHNFMLATRNEAEKRGVAPTKTIGAVSNAVEALLNYRKEATEAWNTQTIKEYFQSYVETCQSLEQSYDELSDEKKKQLADLDIPAPKGKAAKLHTARVVLDDNEKVWEESLRLLKINTRHMDSYAWEAYFKALALRIIAISAWKYSDLPEETINAIHRLNDEEKNEKREALS